MGLVIVVALLFLGVPVAVGIADAVKNARQREQAEKELGTLLLKLRNNPGDLETALALQAVIWKPSFSKLLTSHSGLAYQAALECLEQNPASIKAKTIVLEVGRWHHARCREEQVTTIFDESAMQNDILVRCQMLPEAAKQEVC